MTLELFQQLPTKMIETYSIRPARALNDKDDPSKPVRYMARSSEGVVIKLGTLDECIKYCERMNLPYKVE